MHAVRDVRIIWSKAITNRTVQERVLRSSASVSPLRSRECRGRSFSYKEPTKVSTETPISSFGDFTDPFSRRQFPSTLLYFDMFVLDAPHSWKLIPALIP
jgi:hypothetical protein